MFPARGPVEIGACCEVDQATLAEELAVGIAGLGDAVGVQQQPVTRLELLAPDREPVGARNSRTSCDLLILVEQSAESVVSSYVMDLGGCRVGEWS